MADIVDKATRSRMMSGIGPANMQGGEMIQHSGLLGLDSLDQSAWNDLPQDATVAQRLQEVNFAVAGAQVRSLLMTGDVKGSRARRAQMELAATDHPWLLDKLANLKRLAEDDAVMAAKELRYSSRKLSSRRARLTRFAIA